jgi:DNA repair protein SbcD/Mre11
MTVEPFRFLQASDFHLERTLRGACELPERLRQWFLEAPYRAAQRVFDAAISEAVDFVVLTGDVLDAELTGPRGPIFLLEQFQRLQAAGIAVYWAGGPIDEPHRWPSELRLPDNVHHFPSGRVTERLHHRDGRPIACLRGASRPRGWKVTTTDFAANHHDLPTIALIHGRIEQQRATAGDVTYWALGGKHAAKTFSLCDRTAHYPGTPQGRQPGEAGPHGCTLVRIDAEGDVMLRPIVNDVVRWLTMRLKIDRHATRETFQRLLRDATQALLEQEQGADLLISWNISGAGPLCRQLRDSTLADELLASLRHEFGDEPRSAWSLSLEVESPELESYATLEDKTLLGDFLRTLRHYQDNTDEPIDLTGYIGGQPDEAWRETLARPARAAERDRLLKEVARLGSDLLSGEVQTP